MAQVSASAGAVTCHIKGKDLLDYATSQGRASTATPQSASTVCEPAWPAVTVGGDKEDGICQISYMVGATLSPGWTVGRATIVGEATYAYSKAPGAQSAASLSFSIVARTPPGSSANVSLKEVELSGPNCSDWKAAVH